ncbi:MAG: hypothetical protein ABH881_04140 [bacterium]
MTITPEQFNQIAMKDDLVKLKEEIKLDTNKILNVVDGIAKNYEKFELELLSNQVAHDRFEDQIDKLEINNLKFKKHLSTV